MSTKCLNLVVETHNKKEREELIQFFASKCLLASVIGISDDFQYVAIYFNDVTFLTVIAIEKVKSMHDYIHYHSIKECMEDYRRVEDL